MDTHIRWDEVFAGRTRAGVGEGLHEILALAGAEDLISFGGGFPDPQTFPGPLLAEILDKLVASGDQTAFQYAPTPGLPGPRRFLADRLETLEARRPLDEELLVTSGAVESLELLGKSLIDPGDLVLVERPTYLGAIMAFRSFEANVVGVPMDDGGIDVDALESVVREHGRPKLLYTIPDHQNPTGVSLADDRRGALVDVARRHGFLVVEDVAYRELGWDGERPSCLWSLGPETVVQAGTFSKTFFPGVRLGWAVGPQPVIAQMTSAKQNTDQCAGALGQRLLEEYGRAGGLDEQADRARELYSRRGALMLDALDRHMPDVVRWTRPRGGFFTWLTFPKSVDTTALAHAAIERKVATVPGAPFTPDGSGTSELRLSFSKVGDEDIGEGVRRRADVSAAALRTEPPGSHL
jgi:2-aminoadipate transaminase